MGQFRRRPVVDVRAVMQRVRVGGVWVGLIGIVVAITVFLNGSIPSLDPLEDGVSPEGTLIGMEERLRDSDLTELGPSQVVRSGRLLGGSTEAVSSAREVIIRVLDSGGQPVHGALASWCSLSQSPIEGPNSLEGLESLIELSEWAHSDPDGVVLFGHPPLGASESESVIWVSHPEFLAHAVVLPLHNSQSKKSFDCVLQSAPPLDVYVTYQQPLPIDPTLVVQSGVGGAGRYRKGSVAKRGALDTEYEDRVLKSFVRQYQADSKRPVRVSRGVLPTRFAAYAEGVISDPQLSKLASHSIELDLVVRVTASGVVRRGPGVEIPGDTRVECSWKDGMDTIHFGACPVTESGNWGPFVMPTKARGTYYFKLMGGEFTPEVRAQPTPLAQLDLWIELEGELGKAQAVRVASLGGGPIEGALVDLSWPVKGGWQSASAHSDNNGMALIHGCPDTTAWIRITKPGFTKISRGGIYVVYDEPLEYELEQAGRIEGVVTHLGKPVSDFKVYTWEEDPIYRSEHSFTDRDNGAFVLDTVPQGPISLLASSPNHPESSTLVVDSSSMEARDVALVLPTGGVGTGRVVDSLTGNPLPGATVELVTQFSGRPLGGRGTLHTVDINGYFRVAGVNEDSPTLEASCDGWVASNAYGSLLTGGQVAFGSIPLSCRQDLTVNLNSPNPIPDGEAWFESTGSNGIPIAKVPANGVHQVQGVAPGGHMASVVFMDGTMISQFVRLLPGEDWVIEFDYNPANTLEVLVIPGTGQVLPPGASLHAEYTAASGHHVTRSLAIGDIDEPTRMDHIPSGPVLFFVTANSFLDRVGSRLLTIGVDRSSIVELPLLERTLEVAALDSDGNALDQGVVILDAAEGADIFTLSSSLQAGGVFVLGAIPVDKVLVTVRHPTLGLGTATVQMKPAGVTEVELRVGGSPMDLLIRDAHAPLEAVEVRLIPDGVVTEGFSGKTDETGAWTFKGIPTGGYTVSLLRYGCWPAKHHVDFVGQSPIELSMLRRGDLEMTVRDSGGGPIQGAVVSLHSVELDEGVNSWLLDHKLTPEAVQLTSDAQGHCHARGIPRGGYAWTASLPGSADVSGHCEVPAGSPGELAIVFGQD